MEVTKARLAVAVDEELKSLQDGLTKAYGPRKCGSKPFKDLVLTKPPGLDAAKEDRRKLQQAQEASRYDARRIAALEREVAFLRSVPHYKDAGTQTISYLEQPVNVTTQAPALAQEKNSAIALTTVDIEEYNLVNSELNKVRWENTRILNARDELADKVKKLKTRLKLWAQYQERWVREKGPGWYKAQESDLQEKSLGGHRGHVRAPSAPAQLGSGELLSLDARRLAVPRLTVTSGRSGIDSSGLAEVPTQAVDDVPTAFISRDKVGEDHDSRAPAPGKTVIDDDLTQISGDDDEDTADSNPRRLSKVANGSPRILEPSQEQSSPVVVSTRTLKRKRERNETPTADNQGIRREDDAPGTASKPVQIKSDPCSSSPSVAFQSRVPDDNHDSVDLDEVGSRTKTPRKHQRFIMEQAKLPHVNIEERDDLMHDQYDRYDNDSHEEDHSQSSLRDEAPCRRKGEELAAKLWQEEQARRAQRQEEQKGRRFVSGMGTNVEKTPRLHADPDVDTAETVLETGDRQVEDFNQRIREAQHKIIDSSTKPKTPKPFQSLPSTRYRNSGTDTAGFGLPTPTSIVRPFGSRSGEPTKCRQATISSVLRPADANKQILPRTNDGSDKSKGHCPPSRRDRGAAQIHTVLEDGEETPLARRAKRQKKDSAGENVITHSTTEKGQEASDAHHRLGSLLAEPSPGRPSLPSKRLNVLQRTDQRKSRTPPPKPQPGNLLTDEKSPTELQSSRGVASKTAPSVSKTKKSVTYTKKPAFAALATLDLTTSDDPPPVAPEDEPLRSLPVQRLHREDFKINPAANHGFSHAYREVVRKRVDRKCLPNCNRPDCCGDNIKKMLVIGGPLKERERGLFESSPPDYNDDEGYDYNVLKEYMGDNYHTWTRLSEDEKKAEWARAQQWNFGRKFGKHKAMGRQRTPPGFWNNDIDSTQELEKQREEGDRIAREEVEERWREAMRPGGLWKFADE